MDGCYDYAPLQNFLRTLHPTGERQLVLLKRQYLQQLDSRYIIFPDTSILALIDAQRWIYECVLSHQTEHGVVTKYERLVWKALLQKVEEAVSGLEDPEILDALVNGYAEMCSQPNANALNNEISIAQQDIYLHYPLLHQSDEFDIVSESIPGRMKYLSILEKPRVLSVSGGSGYRTWEAATFLASYLLRESSLGLLRDKTVLELGCGTGLNSLLCSSLDDEKFGNPRRVIATDGDPEAIRRLSRVTEVVKEPSKTRLWTEVYRWGDSFEGGAIEEMLETSKIDLVLAADVLYDPDPIGSLVETLQNLFQHNQSMQAVICYAHRNLQTALKFLNYCSICGFQVERTMMNEQFPLQSQLAYFNNREDTIECLIITLKQ